jgi:hypothetical protein
MKKILSTIMVFGLLAGFAALAVSARPGETALLVQATTRTVAADPASEARADAAAASAPLARTTGFNWVTLPLSNTALVMASDLRSDIQNRSGKTVDAIQKWNAVAQSYQTYAPLPPPLSAGDYALQVGGVYRVSVSGGGAAVTWSLVGDVPAASVFTNTLYETATSDFNWVMLPLDKASVTTAAELKADIEAHSSGAVTVLAVQGWNTVAQSLQTYVPLPPPLSSGDFPVQVGYPYRVSIDVASGASVVWPVR